MTQRPLDSPVSLAEKDLREQWAHLPAPEAREPCHPQDPALAWPIHPFQGVPSLCCLPKERGLSSHLQEMHRLRLCGRERLWGHGGGGGPAGDGEQILVCSHETAAAERYAWALPASKGEEGTPRLPPKWEPQGCRENQGLPDTLGGHWLRMPPH